MKLLKFMRAVFFVTAIAVIILLLWFIIGLFDTNQTNQITLPTENRLEQMGSNTYIYGSNTDIRDLLTDIDIFFKSQGLSSDVNSPVFEYSDEYKEVDGTFVKKEKINTCYEFSYFKGKQLVAAFTLIPSSAECYTNDAELLKKIATLHKEYAHIYATELE